MALKTCYECGEKISTEAASCPHCGAPKSKPEPAGAIAHPLRLFVILAVLVMGGWYAVSNEIWLPKEERIERLNQDRAIAEGLSDHFRRLYDSTGRAAYLDSARLKAREADDLDGAILRLMR